MNLKSNAVSSSFQIIAKQIGTVKNSAAQDILRYININKRKISPQKAYNTEKKSKNNETDPLKYDRFALLDNENSTEGRMVIRHQLS